MYTIGFVPGNSAAKTLSNPPKVRRLLLSQIPYLSERVYGLLVKDAINKGYLDFATSVSFDPVKGVIHRLPGFTVLKAAEGEGRLEHQKAVISKERKDKAKAGEPEAEKEPEVKSKFGGKVITDKVLLGLIESATAKVVPMLSLKVGKDLG